METLQRTANRGSISTGYDIANSVKLEPDNAEFLKRNQADGNRKTWTYSMWVKRTELGMSNGMALFYAGVYHQATRIFFDAGSDAEKLTIDLASEATTQYRWITNRLFRDTSAWYHFVWRVDTTQSTATDRMRMYVNGVLLTADDFQQTATFPQNTDTTANKSSLGGQQQMAIGNYSWANNNGIYAGYAAQCALVDGESLAPTEFGEFDDDTGIWKPKDISGLNYGTGNNSFLLDFETASDLGANAKGNDVNFTLNNITSADQATDTPTNNFATFNIIKRYNQGTMSFQNGGTEVTVGGGGGFWTTVFTSMAVNKGKWYFESEVRVANSTTMYGCTPTDNTELNINTDWYLGQLANGEAGAGFYDNDDAYYHAGGSTACTISGSSFNTQAGDIVMIGVDMDNNKLYAGVNGNWCNSSDNTLPNATGITINDELTYLAMAVFNAATHKANFGGYTTISISSAASDANGYGTFEYAPPSGYYALCTKNLAEFG